MFEGFSFDGPSRRSVAIEASLAETTTPPASVSPMSSRSTSPTGRHRRTKKAPPPLSVIDLSHKLGEHTLLSRRQCSSYLVDLPTPPADQDAFFGPRPSVTSNGPPRTSIEPAPDNVRAQRQLHTQLQCEPAHLQSLATLVAQMVSNGNQCCVYSNTSNPTSSPTNSRSPLSSRASSTSPSSDESEIEGYPRRKNLSLITERWRVQKESRLAYRSTTGRCAPTSGIKLARTRRKRLQGAGDIDDPK